MVILVISNLLIWTYLQTVEISIIMNLPTPLRSSTIGNLVTLKLIFEVLDLLRDQVSTLKNTEEMFVDLVTLSLHMDHQANSLGESFPLPTFATIHRSTTAGTALPSCLNTEIIEATILLLLLRHLRVCERRDSQEDLMKMLTTPYVDTRNIWTIDMKVFPFLGGVLRMSVTIFFEKGVQRNAMVLVRMIFIAGMAPGEEEHI